MTGSEPIQPPGIAPIQPTPSASPAASSGTAGGEFGRILAELDRLAGKEPTGSAAADSAAGKFATEDLDPAALLRRLEEAGESFQKLMDIRSRLEEAWRQGRSTYGKEGPG